jgi:hypothetical protein
VNRALTRVAGPWPSVKLGGTRVQEPSDGDVSLCSGPVPTAFSGSGYLCIIYQEPSYVAVLLSRAVVGARVIKAVTMRSHDVQFLSI